MATVAEPSMDGGQGHRPNRVARAIDRWIYVFMVGWFIVIAFVGFVPDALTTSSAIRVGQAQPFTSIMPLHAALMVAWLMLSLTQTILMATGNWRRHQWLGRLAFLLVPAMVATMLIALRASYRAEWYFAQAAPPDVRAPHLAYLTHASGALLGPLEGAFLFPLLVFIALKARRNDPNLHKRMMVLATAAVLPAALVRMTWLPHFPFEYSAYLIGALLPMFCWDVFRHRTVPRAYVVWFAIWAPLEVGLSLFAGRPWLDAAIPHLMGV